MPPLKIGISLELGCINRLMLDVNAAAYIAAVEAAGATVTSTQRTAVDDFYVAAKADSYYTSLKRLYLPIWGVAAANAIDMITLASGTFNGGVTHGAGFVQGNGSTGYFDFGTSPSAQGLTTSSGHLSALIYQAHSVAGGFVFSLGCRDGGEVGECSLSQNAGASSGVISKIPDYSTSNLADPPVNGIQMADRVSTTDNKMSIRKTSGFTNGSAETTSVAANSIATQNMWAMTLNNNGGGVLFSDARFGALAMGLGLNTTHKTAYSLALKNLFESATGLTLP